MRKAMLILGGLGGSALMIALLWMGVSRTVSGLGADGGICFPCAVERLPLEVLELRSYDGPFLEDGSGRQVQGVAALVLHNTGEALLEKGAVKIQQGEQVLVFSFTMIPPGAKVLVLEKSGKLFSGSPVTACWGWSLEGEMPSYVRVEEAGRSSLTVTNLTDGTLHQVKIYYKAYDARADLYMGGYSHCVEVQELRPGHCQVVTAWRYISGESRVIGG